MIGQLIWLVLAGERRIPTLIKTTNVTNAPEGSQAHRFVAFVLHVCRMNSGAKPVDFWREKRLVGKLSE